MKFLTKSLLLISALLALHSGQAQAVGLDFDTAQGTPHSSDAYNLGPYYSTASVNFLGVATIGGTTVDMRVTASAFGTYQLYGHYADYNNGDIGVLYNATSYGSGGMDYKMEFFTSGSNFTTRYSVSNFSLLLYDVDGESAQSEAFRAFTADGLQSYQLSTSPSTVTPTAVAGGFDFMGQGTNLAETDRTAAVLLNYANTNTVNLRFESTTTSGNLPNGVFTGIDGNMNTVTGSWNSAVTVPEPSSAFLVLVFGICVITRRRR